MHLNADAEFQAMVDTLRKEGGEGHLPFILTPE